MSTALYLLQTDNQAICEDAEKMIEKFQPVMDRILNDDGEIFANDSTFTAAEILQMYWAIKKFQHRRKTRK